MGADLNAAAREAAVEAFAAEDERPVVVSELARRIKVSRNAIYKWLREPRFKTLVLRAKEERAAAAAKRPVRPKLSKDEALALRTLREAASGEMSGEVGEKLVRVQAAKAILSHDLAKRRVSVKVSKPGPAAPGSSPTPPATKPFEVIDGKKAADEWLATVTEGKATG